MRRRHFLGLLAASGLAVAGPSSLWAAPRQAAQEQLFGNQLSKGLVTFSFDDGIVSDYNFALPLLKRRGQVATAGIVVSRMLSGNDDYMNVDQVRELAANGWEIASHSLTHTRPIQIPKTYEQEVLTGWHSDEKAPNLFQTQYDYDLISGIYQDGKPFKPVESLEALEATPGTYFLDRPIAELHVHPFRVDSPEKLNILAGSYQRELEHSKRMLVDVGFDVDTYVAPYNYWTDDVEAMSRKYYSRACTGRDSDNRADTFDPFAIKRFMIHSKDSPQGVVRIIKDHAIDKGGWVVFCMHGVGESTGWEPFPAESLDFVADFIARENIPLVTVRDGARIMLDRKKQLQTKSIVKKGS